MRFFKIPGNRSIPPRFENERLGLGGGNRGAEVETAVQVKSFQVDTPGDRKGGSPPLVDSAGGQSALHPVQAIMQIDVQFFEEFEVGSPVDPVCKRLPEIGIGRH